jgi:hypothetical protein
MDNNEKSKMIVGCLYVIIVLLAIPIIFLGLLIVAIFGTHLPQAIMECISATFYGIHYH